MNTTDQSVIEPAAGCSPAGGLPRDCQGRHGEFHGGSGKDAVSAAVPGSSESDVEVVGLDMPLAFQNAMKALFEMYKLVGELADTLSMKQCLYYRDELMSMVRCFESDAKALLKNDFPHSVRGYKDIPE